MSQANAFRNAMRQQQMYNLAGSPLLLEIMSRLNIESIINTHAPAGAKQVDPARHPHADGHNFAG